MRAHGKNIQARASLWRMTAFVAALALFAAGANTGWAAENRAAPTEDKPVQWVSAVKAKPLSEPAKRGLKWLVEHQHDSGGWSQGEESTHMGTGMAHLKDKSNVGDTCAAVLALIRSGSTPKEGPHAKSIRKGIAYVCSEVEESDKDSLFVTQTRGTRLQGKLGTYIDTFLASMLLAEVKGNMPAKEGNARVTTALNKVVAKLEKNQRDDGSFGGGGWANTLSQSMAAKGMNRAAQAGAQVSEETLDKSMDYARKRFDEKSGKFSAEGSAGVDLYASASSLSAMQDSDNTNTEKRNEVQRQLAQAETDAERVEAEGKLDRMNANAADLASAREAIVEKLDDAQFISGFGSNGGEEFLSYMNIGESLVVTGGAEWKKWDEEITANLNRIQNGDGSWSGHHCITGRTFCTSAALLVLMTDRAPVPVAATMRRR